jgi:hypothetical protein
MPKFHAFTIVEDHITNRLINNVVVSDSTKTSHAISPVGQQTPKMDCIALWDTGATNTVISPAVVATLGLSAFGEVEVWGVSGPNRATIHVIDLWLPNFIAIPKLVVTMGILGDIDVLIGMDVICKGDFAVSNFGGKTAFTYRTPSVELADYCQ